MALMNRKAEASTVTQETPSETPAQEQVVEQAPVETPKTTEVAVKAEAGPVASGSSGFWYSNPAVQEVVATSGYGDFPQIIASQGQFMESGANGKELGKWISFKPIQAKIKQVCSPNSNDEEAKEYFAACYVGETLIDGRSIEEALEDAKSAGYDKASIKEYVDLFAYVTAAETNSDSFADEVVILQLAPMSKIEWQKFSKKLEIKAAFGKIEAGTEFIVKANAKNAKNKANQGYTHYAFELA